MRDFFEDSPVVATLIGIVVLFFVFVIIDCIGSKSEILVGNVIDKHYKAESIHYGTKTNYISKGNYETITTREVDPEKYLIIAKFNDGQIVTVECSTNLYYQKNVGDKIDVKINKGLLSGAIWSIKGVK